MGEMLKIVVVEKSVHILLVGQSRHKSVAWLQKTRPLSIYSKSFVDFREKKRLLFRKQTRRFPCPPPPRTRLSVPHPGQSCVAVLKILGHCGSDTQARYYNPFLVYLVVRLPPPASNPTSSPRRPAPSLQPRRSCT
jgi:hypothetical protein